MKGDGVGNLATARLTLSRVGRASLSVLSNNLTEVSARQVMTEMQLIP